jgi:hypothetical protein
MTSRITVCAAIFIALLKTVVAEELQTVQTLLKQNFAIVGAITSPAGPGLFLQKKDQLFICFVAEIPRSPTVATRYCKPVQ